MNVGLINWKESLVAALDITYSSCCVFIPQVQGVQQSKDTTLASNRNLAELNLGLQPQLEERKEQLTKRYNCLQESFETYQFRKSTLGMLTHD